MELVLFLVYAVVGMLISIPYCLLAGWSWEHWSIVTIAAPVFMVVWMVLGLIAGHIYVREGKRSIGLSWASHEHLPGIPHAKEVFYAWTFYCFLPIIIRWVSVLIDFMGYEYVANALNAHRYATPLYVFVLLVCLLLLFGVAVTIVDAIKTGYAKLFHRTKP